MKTKMQDDIEDIPMSYFWYPVLAIVAMGVAAMALIVRWI